MKNLRIEPDAVKRYTKGGANRLISDLRRLGFKIACCDDHGGDEFRDFVTPVVRFAATKRGRVWKQRPTPSQMDGLTFLLAMAVRAYGMSLLTNKGVFRSKEVARRWLRTVRPDGAKNVTEMRRLMRENPVELLGRTAKQYRDLVEGERALRSLRDSSAA